MCGDWRGADGARVCGGVPCASPGAAPQGPGQDLRADGQPGISAAGRVLPGEMKFLGMQLT